MKTAASTDRQIANERILESSLIVFCDCALALVSWFVACTDSPMTPISKLYPLQTKNRSPSRQAIRLKLRKATLANQKRHRYKSRNDNIMEQEHDVQQNEQNHAGAFDDIDCLP